MDAALWQVGLAVLIAFFGGIVIRTAGLRASLQMFRESNEELRREVEYRDKACREALAEQDTKHAREMGELRGQLNVLQSEWMKALRHEVAAAAADRVMNQTLERQRLNREGRLEEPDG